MLREVVSYGVGDLRQSEHGCREYGTHKQQAKQNSPMANGPTWPDIPTRLNEHNPGNRCEHEHHGASCPSGKEYLRAPEEKIEFKNSHAESQKWRSHMPPLPLLKTLGAHTVGHSPMPYAIRRNTPAGTHTSR